MGRDRVAPTNEVQLVGRVSGDPTQRELPSGDVLVQLRVVVPRPPRRAPRQATAGEPDEDSAKDSASARQRLQVDTIDVACWTARSRAAALRLVDGAGARVEGSLRRRFFSTGAGRASRYEVEARSVRRVELAG